MIMTNKHYYTAIISTCVIMIGAIPTVKAADRCVPIPLVGGEGNTVTKRVSGPTIPGPIPGVDLTRNNRNTDWSVRGGSKRYRYFVVTINSNDEGPFDIRFFLKYSDQTTGEFFNNQRTIIQPKQPLVVRADVRPNDKPYQVNLFVNGVQGIGKTYTASVVGCS
jgi:hypothetical protein